MLDKKTLNDCQCSFCGRKEFRMMEITSTPYATMNYEIDGVYHSIRVKNGAICMHCGHVEYFVDMQEFER